MVGRLVEGKEALLTWYDSVEVLTRIPQLHNLAGCYIKCLLVDSLQSCKLQEMYIGQITAVTGRLYLFNCAPVIVTEQLSIN